MIWVMQVGMALSLPDRLMAISTVGQFVQLVEMAEKDMQLKKMVGATA